MYYNNMEQPSIPMEMRLFWYTNTNFRNSQYSIEPKGSLQCSQYPATNPYNERDKSTYNTDDIYALNLFQLQNYEENLNKMLYRMFPTNILKLT